MVWPWSSATTPEFVLLEGCLLRKAGFLNGGIEYGKEGLGFEEICTKYQRMEWKKFVYRGGMGLVSVEMRVEYLYGI